jgi:hypothetical protein
MICEEETERENTKRIRIKIVNVSSEIMEIAACYNERVNNDSLGLAHILTKGEVWMEMEKVTTKELQSILKAALNKTLA